MIPPPVAHHLRVSRTARYFTQGEFEGAAEIWFVLHGYSMLAASFLQWFEPAVAPGRLLVAPEGLSRAYFEEKGGRRVGASWMTKDDRDTEIDDYVEYLDRVADRIRFGVAGEPRIEVHGFSQGAATACRWAALGTTRADRLVLWGQGVPPDLPLDRYGQRLTRAGLTIALGTRDRYLGAEDVDRELARLAAAGLEPQVHRFEGGHRVEPAALRALIQEGKPA
ncbi:MAG: alpha/beta hydrolase [Gemmatimonadales bacterium]